MSNQLNKISYSHKSSSSSFSYGGGGGGGSSGAEGSGFGFGFEKVGDASQKLNSMLSHDHSKSKGCSSKPKQPMNAALRCSSASNTCKATCVPDYQFPNGETNLFISCVDTEWIIKDSEWSEIPSCERND